MAPTVIMGDRVTGRMGRPTAVNRGDVLLVEANRGSTYIVRVVGLPGDRIELRGGIVHLNGQTVPQRLVRVESAPPGPGGGGERRRLEERLPGQPGMHEIYDAGDSEGDDSGPVTVQPGHLFLLGDNRDDSNDSRFPRESEGLGQVSLDRVRGVVLAIYRPE